MNSGHFIDPDLIRPRSAFAGALVALVLVSVVVPGARLHAEEADSSELERQICSSLADRQLPTLTYLDGLLARLHGGSGAIPSTDLLSSRVADLTRALTPRLLPLAEVGDDLRAPGQLAFYRSQERGLVLEILGEHGIEASDIPGATFAFADLDGATLPEAKLSGVNLFRAHLARSDLRGADMRGATLAGADLYGSSLLRADLREALLVRADLRYADLENVELGGADLRGAKLHSANLRGAELDGTILFGVDLSGVRNLVQGQLDRACTDDATRIPAGLRAVAIPERCNRVDTSRVRALFAAPGECGVPPEPELRRLLHSLQAAPTRGSSDGDSLPGTERER